MELETVSAVSVSGFFGHVFRQIDNFDGLEWASLHAHAATNAQRFGDEAYGGGGLNFDADFADLVARTIFRALLSTLLRFALIWVDNCDSEL